MGDATQNKNTTQEKTTSGLTAGICSTGDTIASVACSQALIRLLVCSLNSSISSHRFEM